MPPPSHFWIFQFLYLIFPLKRQINIVAEHLQQRLQFCISSGGALLVYKVFLFLFFSFFSFLKLCLLTHNCDKAQLVQNLLKLTTVHLIPKWRATPSTGPTVECYAGVQLVLGKIK